MLRRCLCVVAVAILVSCSKRPSPPVQADPIDASVRPPPPPKWSLTLKRTVCYGSCPAYEVTVDQDGFVQYEGHEYVSARGKHSARVSLTEVAKLVDRAQALDFARLAPRYPTPCTDQPRAVVTFTVGAVSTPIEHGGTGGRCTTAPAQLLELEKEIDRVVDIDRWTTCHDDAGAVTGCESLAAKKDLTIGPVVGDAFAAVAERKLSEWKWMFGTCYTAPEEVGTVKIKATIDATGEVDKTTIVSNGAPAAVGSCVAMQMSKMTFPKPPAGSATITVPIAMTIRP